MMDYSVTIWPACLWLISWTVYMLLLVLILKALYDNDAGIKTWLFVIALCLGTFFFSGPTYLVKDYVTRPYQSDLVADAYKKGIEGEPNYESEANKYYKMTDKQKETIQGMIHSIDAGRLKTAYRYNMYNDADVSDVNSICLATISRTPFILVSMVLLFLLPAGTLAFTVYMNNKQIEEAKIWISQKENEADQRIAYKEKELSKKEEESRAYWTQQRMSMKQEINERAKNKVQELLKEQKETIDKNRQTINDQDQKIKEQEEKIKDNISKLNDFF